MCYSKKARMLVATIFLLSMQQLSWADCLGDKESQWRYSVYVVPQLAPAHLYSHWGPFLDQLGRESNFCFELEIPKSIPEFENELREGTPDFAFMNPYHLVMTQKRQKYIPLIADGQTKLDGILVVRKDSDIKNLLDLKNDRVAFPAPNAFAASLLVRATLASKGIKVTPVYVKSHENVYRSVILGDTSAGGGVNNTLAREPEEIRSQLKVIFETPGYMPHPFAAHPRISAKARAIVIKAFLRMASEPSGQHLLDGVQIPRPVAVNYAKDYAPIQRLGLDKFVAINEK